MSTALAHDGHGFMDGMMHFHGQDFLFIGIIIVGLWAARKFKLL